MGRLRRLGETLQQVRPVAVAYALVLMLLLGVLVDRRGAQGPTLPALAPGIGRSGPGSANLPAVRHEEEYLPAAGPLWLRLLRPDRELARSLLEQALPLLGPGERRLVVYGGPARPRNLFEALFPFLARGSSPGEAPWAPDGTPPPPGEPGGPSSGRPAPGDGSGSLVPGGPRPGGAAGPGQAPNPDPSSGPAAAVPPGAGCQRPPGTPLVGGGVPLVAIYHTHDYESYISEFPGLQPETPEEWASVWTTDPERNIIRVGRELARALCERGVTVVHSPTRHAPPMGYFGAYTESRKTAQFILKEYPSIRLLLDLHRDGEVPRELATATVPGAGPARTAARVLIVVGTGHDEAPQPNWEQNLALAREIHAALEARYPGLSRGISRRQGARYNQDLLPGALLFEIGSVRNGMPEALRTAQLLAEVLADWLRQKLGEAPAPRVGMETGGAGRP